MSLRQAAQDVIAGRQARKELEPISSDTKIARKCEVHRSVVERIWAGLPTRLVSDDERQVILDLKREQQRLLTIQRRNTLAVAAYRHGVTPSAVRVEVELMGVEV